MALTKFVFLFFHHDETECEFSSANDRMTVWQSSYLHLRYELGISHQSDHVIDIDIFRYFMDIFWNSYWFGRLIMMSLIPHSIGTHICRFGCTFEDGEEEGGKGEGA